MRNFKPIKAWAVVIKSARDGFDGMNGEDRISLSNIYESAKAAEVDWMWDLDAKKVQIIPIEIRPARKKVKK